ncbi:MAG: lipopolysaccharide heptosyltransferase II [Betaproteobacteria bacterium]|nr:lipopolysaccharide heptosyltransferase II [Betaproteobacteria bacterium]
MKILVVAPAWVGDTVMAQPMFTLLHERHANLQLDVLAPPFTLPLLSRMPEVRRGIVAHLGHGELKLNERRRIARELQAERYDQAIVLPNSFKSALIPLLAKIPLRTGFRGEMRYGLLNDVRRLDEKALPRMVQRFAVLALQRGAHLPPTLPQPRLTAQPLSAKNIQLNQILTKNMPLAVFCPGAEYGPAKRWPAEHFGTLAAKAAAAGHAVALIGSPKDADIGAAIAHASNNACVNLCGHTSLEDAIDIIARAALVVSNDSGLMHVAAALDRPLLALYGSSSPAFTPPLCDKAQILKIDIDCSPCFKRECPLGHFKCMRELAPALVWQHVVKSV